MIAPRVKRIVLALLLAPAARAACQEPATQEHVHVSGEPASQEQVHEHAAAQEASSPMDHAEEPTSSPDVMGAMLSKEPGDEWMTMFHGFAYLTFDRQSGPSGGQDFESQNHVMLAALHRLWGGKLSLLGTFSLEPATIPQAGSYELFQRGETYNDILLIDRQHPHDLFIELAAQWERRLSETLALRLYLAPVGEPALGPIAYPHRLSASMLPLAPLSHHNQDSTHITYDVITGAADWGPVTVEGSVFHGAEPNENRWDIQAGSLDSYSGRLTLHLPSDLQVQLSAGHLEHPEAIEPGNQTRVVGAAYWQRATPDGFIALSLISGLNDTEEGREWGSLLEGTWKFAGVNSVFGRVEAVDRDIYELIHKTQRPEDVPHVRTRVWAATLGVARDVPLFPSVETSVGASATLHHFTSRVDSVYGTTPFGFQAYFRIGFGSHAHGHMH
jgi:hypothetical protein